jgi:uncharacterized protein (DUF2267 family)
MARQFTQFAIEADKFVKQLAADLGHAEDLDKSRRILKSVLHTLRDRMSIQESFQLMAQLPTLLKGLYVENWKYSERPLNYRSKQSLFEALKAAEHLTQTDDFPNQQYAVHAVNAVLKNLSQYVSAGEMADVLAQLPTEIRSLVNIK